MSNIEDAARAAAEEFRSAHKLGTGALVDLFDLVYETVGIDVQSMDSGDREHGLAVVDPASGRVSIVVATTQHPVRQRSSIAHELGHVISEQLMESAAAQHGARTSSETFADTFARHLLLPQSAAEAAVLATGEPDLALLSYLVQRFGVSPQVAAIQLHGLNRITQSTKREWSGFTTRRLAATFGWLNAYDRAAEASQRPRAPRGLMMRAAAAYQAGKLSAGELALWYGNAADELTQELGQPSPPPTTHQTEPDWDKPLFSGPAT